MKNPKIVPTPEITERELYEEWENDFDKYPLPICFDPQEERKELNLRSRQIKDDVKKHLKSLSSNANPVIPENHFEVKRFTNGLGHSHLVVITEEAITDISIGTVLIVPYAEGFKDPKKVILMTDENGTPQVANKKFAIVKEFIYE